MTKDLKCHNALQKMITQRRPAIYTRTTSTRKKTKQKELHSFTAGFFDLRMRHTQHKHTHALRAMPATQLYSMNA